MTPDRDVSTERQNIRRTVPLRRAYGFMLATLLIGVAAGLLLYTTVPYPYVVVWTLLAASPVVMIVSYRLT